MSVLCSWGQTLNSRAIPTIVKLTIFEAVSIFADWRRFTQFDGRKYRQSNGRHLAKSIAVVFGIQIRPIRPETKTTRRPCRAAGASANGLWSRSHAWREPYAIEMLTHDLGDEPTCIDRRIRASRSNASVSSAFPAHVCPDKQSDDEPEVGSVVHEICPSATRLRRARREMCLDR